MSFWFDIWHQEDLDELKAPWQEFMGIDVYGDGKRNFYRAIADDIIAELNAAITNYQAIITIAPILQQNMRMTVSGHEDPNLDCNNKLIKDALLNVIIAPIDEELTELKNPAGETEYLKMHNQNIAARKVWNKYAGRTLSCIWKGSLGYIESISSPHGFTENEVVIINISQTPYPPIGMEGIIYEGGSYRIGILDEWSFFLRNMDGSVIPMPYGSWCLLTVIRQKKTEILGFSIQANLYSLLVAQLSCDIIGLYDSTGEFYIVIKDPVFGSQAIELVSFKMALVAWSESNPAKQKMIEYPTPHQYLCVHWPMKDVVFGTEEAIKMSVSITGRNLDIPENFGLSTGIRTSRYYIDAEEGSFGAMLHPSDSLRELYEHIPRGFYWFASKYYDHPLVTGIDNDNLITRSDDEEMALALEINAYVNNTYSYMPENTDNWEFMGAGRQHGDCEDFMLTKAQMMIDAGISVKNIKLDCGFPDVDSDEIVISGHAWLLYKDQYVMDTSSNSFLTVNDMLKWYPRRHTQVSGLSWLYEASIKTLPAKSLWPTHAVDIKMFDFDCYIKKLTR